MAEEPWIIGWAADENGEMREIVGGIMPNFTFSPKTVVWGKTVRERFAECQKAEAERNRFDDL